jgi:hypothetical protein
MSDHNSENLGGNGVCGAISGSEVGREGLGRGYGPDGFRGWGIEIGVAGRRPEWLSGDPKRVMIGTYEGRWIDPQINGEFDDWIWSKITSIRLPADHPHYRGSRSTDIEWGPAIAVDGKRPGWLGDGDRIGWTDQNGWTHDPDVPWLAGETTSWDDKVSIVLPVDHPHYRQPAPIDWSGELEAVHEDGRVVRVKLSYDRPECSRYGGYTLKIGPIGGLHVYRKDGSSWVGGPWRIRNVTPQPTPQAGTKPDVTARMEALVRRMAGEPGRQLIAASDGDYAEARAIVALLPEPVDPDLIEARKLAAVWSESQDVSHSHYLDGHMDDSAEVRGMVAAIARGRELALAGEKAK